jgi:hypothetical protein
MVIYIHRDPYLYTWLQLLGLADIEFLINLKVSFIYGVR